MIGIDGSIWLIVVLAPEAGELAGGLAAHLHLLRGRMTGDQLIIRRIIGSIGGNGGR